MASPASSSAAVPPNVEGSRISADHPGIIELFGVLAAGELAAFYRLTSEASMAPTLAGRLAIARMAASEMRHFETLATELGRRNADPLVLVTTHTEVIESYHQSTTPHTWLESIVKAYIGDALAADFYLEVAGRLPSEAEAVVREVMAATSSSEFVVGEVRAAIEADPNLRSPLTLWGRRLLGEAITQAQFVLAAEENLTDLVLSEISDLTQIAKFFESIQERHAARMADLGLC